MFSFSCLNSSLFISINKFWESCCSVVFMPQSLNPPHLVIYRLLVIACQTGRRNNGQEQAVVHHKLIWKGLWEVVGPPAWIVSNPFSTAAAPTLLKHRCLLIFFFYYSSQDSFMSAGNKPSQLKLQFTETFLSFHCKNNSNSQYKGR